MVSLQVMCVLGVLQLGRCLSSCHSWCNSDACVCSCWFRLCVLAQGWLSWVPRVISVPARNRSWSQFLRQPSGFCRSQKSVNKNINKQIAAIVSTIRASIVVDTLLVTLYFALQCICACSILVPAHMHRKARSAFSLSRSSSSTIAVTDGSCGRRAVVVVVIVAAVAAIITVVVAFAGSGPSKSNAFIR